MRMHGLSLLAVSLTMLCSCVGPGGREAARASLFDTDRAFAGCANDKEKSLTFFADEVIYLPANRPIIHGKDGVRSLVAQMFSGPGVSLSFQPSTAHVSKSGDLGYTIGAYQLKTPDERGEPTTIAGKYITVWRKQPGGEWKVVADCFNSD